MAVYLTLYDLRSKFGLVLSSSKDEAWQNYLDMAEASCLRFVGLSSKGEGEATVFFDADEVAGGRISLPLLPCTEAHISIDASHRFLSELDASSYRLDPATGRVTFYDVTIPTGSDVIRVVEKYGFAKETLPEDFLLSIVWTFQYIVKLTQTDQVGITQRTSDGGTESIEQNLPPLAAQKTLNRYRFGRLR